MSSCIDDLAIEFRAFVVDGFLKIGLDGGVVGFDEVVFNELEHQ